MKKWANEQKTSEWANEQMSKREKTRKIKQKMKKWENE